MRNLGAMTCPLICLVICLLPAIVMIASLWKVFEKAGQPGWACLIPIYNNYILTCEVAKKDIMWFILIFIPIANIVSACVVAMEVARKFGRSEGFGVGIILLPFIFYPILAFGDAEYRGGRSRDNDDDDYDDDYDRPRRNRRDDDFEDDDDYDRPRSRR